MEEPGQQRQETQRKTTRVAAAVAGVLLLAVFVADLAIPLGFAAGVLYVAVVLASLRFSRTKFTFAVAITATTLTILGYFFSSSLEAASWAVIANRGLAIFAIWATAVLGVRVRQVGEEVRSSEQQIRAIVDTAVDAIITIDRRGIVQTFNHAAERMFGYRPDEVLGENVSILMPSPYRNEHDSYLERYLRTGEARIIGIGREVTAQRKDGSVFPIELAVSQADHAQMFTGFIRDISERREAEERLRQADRLSSIGTLAAGLGHDMNNVLLPVRARLDLIENTELPANVRRHVAEVRKSAKYLQDLADGLHLLALDPEDREASTELTDLSEWWEHVRVLLSRALPKHVRFAASIPSGLPAIGVAPHRLTQAVLNMLVNSGKAVGKDGRVRLWSDTDASHSIVRLGVTDNGCGMTAEVKRRALEPFFTTKTRGLGTGLGLSLVHGVVKAAGGDVHIDSEPGKGATIILAFPAVTGPCPASVDDVEEFAPRAIVSVQDKRIESLLTNLLEMSGFEAMTGSGQPPTETTLWVTDADAEAIGALRNGVAEKCRVIVLGPVPADLSGTRLSIVDDPNDFTALQAAINGVAEGATTS